MRKSIIAIIVASAFLVTISTLVYTGVLWPNKIFAARYSVKGIDVSNHQGTIDWTKVAEDKKIGFVFIKASEGKDYKDPFFEENWKGASAAGIYKGAYHYFTTEDSGFDQAMNFIGMVPVEPGCLPPVVDIETYDIGREEFRNELTDYLKLIEATYGQKPILYVVDATYGKYIKGAFEEYAVWVREIIIPARLSDGRSWMFWQYGNRGRVKGIDTYVDLNVFRGTMEQLTGLLSR